MQEERQNSDETSETSCPDGVGGTADDATSPLGFPDGQQADGDSLTLDEDDWAGDAIERAYRQALQASEAAESSVIDVGGFDSPDSLTDESGDSSALNPNGDMPEDPADSYSENLAPSVTPRQIIEAALFVGGTPLTIKRIGMLLRNEFDQDFVESTIDSLNSQYSEEQRPYEITFGEGGYRLVLHPEFERLRARTYGFGPKEVKLSQDALEVLALVAYRQPVSGRQIEAAGKSNPGSILRLLVRRQLIAIERTGKKRDDVIYRTTPRFLELFGLKGLDELPQSDGDLNFK